MRSVLGAMGMIGRVLAAAARRVFFAFDASKVSFTPSMAKRNAGGPFAAGVLVQGKVVDASASDVLTLARGSQIASSFYANFDPYQGTLNVWITPEWAGADGLNHYIAQWSTNGYLAKNAAGSLILSVASGKSMTVACAFVAGTTYHVVARWDSKNTLDGMNYLCISVNDTHTFGLTSSYTPEAPSENIYVGAAADGSGAVAALLEGLTILRLPAWDGLYGVDQGEGDVINLAYASGAGLDVTELLGSWGVVACIPTNATPGALTTGSTDAWSHPHSSEVLADAFCQTAYADSAWDDVGTPVAPVSVAFNGTSTGINAGHHASLANLFFGAVTYEGWVRKTSNTNWILFDKRVTANTGFLVYNTSIWTYDASGSPGVAIPVDNRWHHFALTFDYAGDKKIRVYVDGVLGGTGVAFTPTTDDATADLFIGRDYGGSSFSLGAIGWLRVSNNIRYAENFVPPARTSPPAADANTVRLFPMNEGGGTTITDSSTNAQNGTLSNGTWNNSRDMATDAPGERVYNWGYVSGSDAANEGITQALSGLTPGANYVIRPVLHYGVNAIPKIAVLDATNADAEISSMTCPNQQTTLVVNGTFDSDTNGWTAPGAGGSLASVAGGVSGNCLQVTAGSAAGQLYTTQSIQLTPYATYRITFWRKKGSAGGVVAIGSYYNSGQVTYASWTQTTGLFVAPASGLVTLSLGVISHSQTTLFDSITLTRVIDSKRPWNEPFSFELPTIARNGVAADCTAIKVQVTNTAATGVVSVQQVELLPNLIDNPGMSVGAGDPWLASGWIAQGTPVAGDISFVAGGHSSGNVPKFIATAKTFIQSPVVTSNNFHTSGIWCRSGNATSTQALYRDSAPLQSTFNTSPTGRSVQGVQAWKLLRHVSRATATTGRFMPWPNPNTEAYYDDAYCVALDAVTLTVTPASLANSTETSGLRVDGRDTALQAVENCSATSGTLKWQMTPRHSAADVAKFGEATPYILDFYGDANNWLRLYWSAANTVTLDIKCAGLTATQTWGATGAIVAGTTYACELDYNPTTITFKVADVARITNSTGGFTLGTLPTNVYWGHKQDGSCQYDATFTASA